MDSVPVFLDNMAVMLLCRVTGYYARGTWLLAGIVRFLFL
jgi:hypothetical protein